MSIQLSKVRHISFDFWNTLAFPNGDYTHQRNWNLCEPYGIYNLKTTEQKYRSTKKFLESAAELSGYGTTAANCWEILNRQFQRPLSSEALAEFVLSIEQLFIDNPPSFPNELPEVLAQLKEQGITSSILSNAHFVRGELLRDQIVVPTFGDAFLFQMYSDEYEMSKPNVDFFNTMVRATQGMRPGGCSKATILHVGDNVATDEDGALHAGLQFMKVTSPDDLVIKLKLLLATGQVD